MAYRYKTVKINGKTKLLHRHIMEKKLGRPLRRDEHVHHKNGDQWDNGDENLELLSCKDHMHEHKQKHPETKVCENCGVTFRPHPTKRARNKTCSQACGAIIAWRTRHSLMAEALVRANVVEQSNEAAEVA